MCKEFENENNICNNDIDTIEQEFPTPQTDNAKGAPLPEKRNFKRLLKLAIPAVIAIAIVTALLFCFVFKGDDVIQKYVYYMTDDGEIWIYSPTSEPYKLIDNGGANFGAMFSTDGKKVFFKDENGVNYWSYAGKHQKPVKIDDGYFVCYVSIDGDTVIYEKEGVIYKYSADDDSREMLVENATLRSANKECNKILYKIEDDGYFVKESGKDAVKICGTDIVDFEYVNDDLEEFYYIEDGSDEDTLHKFDYDNGESEIIDTNIRFIIKIYDEGVYYSKYKDGDQYLEVNGRSTYDPTTLLCFYDGSQSKVLANNFFGIQDMFYWPKCHSEEPVIAFYSPDLDTEKGKEECLNSEFATVSIAYEDEVFAVDIEFFNRGLQNLEFSDDGDYSYIIGDMTLKEDERYYRGTLYEIDNSDGSVEPLYENATQFHSCHDGNYFYTKTNDINDYNLYYNGKLIEENIYSIKEYNKKTGQLFYFSSYKKDLHGTLKVTDGTTTELVLDHVYAVEINQDTGDTYYLADYENGAGDLYLYGNDNGPIATNIVTISWMKRFTYE